MATTIDKTVLDMAKAQYRKMAKEKVYDDEYDRDEEGFIILKPTSNHVEEQQKTLTTSIDQLQSKLNKYMTEKKHYDDIASSDDFKKESKKKKKKNKKAKASLLASIFNNADAIANVDDEDIDEDDEDAKSSDSGKKSKKPSKPKDTLDSTYGMRFAPIVSYLQDAISEFDELADDIQAELKTKGTSRGVYRSSQMANLISAKNSKLSAVKELTTVARLVSDLELKKAKEANDKSTSTETMVAKFGSKFLSGSFDDLDDFGVSIKKKKKNKGDSGSSGKSAKKHKYDFMSMTEEEREEFDDEDYSESNKKKDKGRVPEQKELAKMFAEKMIGRKDEFHFTPQEKHIAMEGKYEVVVVVEDILNPSKSWKFTAVDKKGREIDGFRKDYKELLPNKKTARMTFDMAKMKAINRATNLKYRILVKDD